MAQINWSRLIVGCLIAAIIMFVTDGFIHETIAKADWRALYVALGAREPEPHGSSLLYFAIFELGRGFTAISGNSTSTTAPMIWTTLPSVPAVGSAPVRASVSVTGLTSSYYYVPRYIA